MLGAIPSHLVRFLAAAAATCAIAGAGAWAALALAFRGPSGPLFKAAAVAAWCIFCIAIMVVLWHGGAAGSVGLFAAAWLTLLAWWVRLEPRNDRDWSDEVARLATGTIEGPFITLHAVRCFEWRTTEDYDPRWEPRRYDLRALRHVDMIMSYWRGPSIAHMLVSFGFDGGAQLVLSVEIRRQKSQRFSELGGFFKEFELSIIAADERDAVRLRTNIRAEEAYLYRLRLPEAAMRALLLAYVHEANRLAEVPRFYHTIMGNCTTLVYRMMTPIVGRLPLSPRLLFSGYLPEYVHRIGGLDARFSLEELRASGRITERARRADLSPTFSADIRRGLPGLDPQPVRTLEPGRHGAPS